MQRGFKLLTAGLCAIVAATFANSRSVWGSALNIAASSDANITGGSLNFYNPALYSLVVNVFDNSRAIVDVPLAAVPLNATVNGVQVNFYETSYSNTNGLVSISGYGRTGAITASDGSVGASTVGSYNSVALGTGAHSVTFNSTGVGVVSSLLGTKKHLGLRFASASNDTNTGFGAIEQSSFFTPPSVTVSYTLPNNPQLVPQFDANITGSTVNQYDPALYGLIVNTFDSTKGVIDYSLAGLPGVTLASASFTFRETSFTSSSGLVSIYAYSRSGPITSTDANAPGTLVGSYDSTSLGLGSHTVSLNSAGLSIIRSLLGTNQDLGLRFVDGSGHANTQFGSLEGSPGFPAPMLSLTFAPDLNRDGHVNAADVKAMMNALANESTYAQSVGLSTEVLSVIGDVNKDGIFSNADLQSLLLFLKNGNGSESVPEPNTIGLLAIGGGIALVIKRTKNRTPTGR